MDQPVTFSDNKCIFAQCGLNLSRQVSFPELAILFSQMQAELDEHSLPTWGPGPL